MTTIICVWLTVTTWETSFYTIFLPFHKNRKRLFFLHSLSYWVSFCEILLHKVYLARTHYITVWCAVTSWKLNLYKDKDKDKYKDHDKYTTWQWTAVAILVMFCFSNGSSSHSHFHFLKKSQISRFLLFLAQTRWWLDLRHSSISPLVAAAALYRRRNGNLV